MVNTHDSGGWLRFLYVAASRRLTIYFAKFLFTLKMENREFALEGQA